MKELISTLKRKIFLKMHVNQSYLSSVKGGELAIYFQNSILGQLIVAASQPENIDEYICKRTKLN